MGENDLIPFFTKKKTLSQAFALFDLLIDTETEGKESKMADMETQESLPPDSSLNDPDDAENRSVPQISK